MKTHNSRSWIAYLVLLITLCAIPWLPMAAYVQRFNSIGEIGIVRTSSQLLRLESEHFILQFPEGYMSETDSNEFLALAETTLSDLKAFLNPPALAEDEKIVVRAMEGAGISRIGGSNLILLYYIREGVIPLAHELTHVLMGESSSRLLTDGLAVYCQERFGGLSYPSFFRSIEAATLGELRRGRSLSLLDLRMNIGFEGQTWRLAYLEAGSFARYLIDRYEFPLFEQVYSTNDFLSAYDMSLAELEGDWLESLWQKNLLVSAFHMALGIICLCLISTSLKASSFYWLPVVAVAPISLAVFDLYFYMTFPSSLAIALQTLSLFSLPWANKLPLKWIRLMVWVLGLSFLVYSEISPLLHFGAIALGN